MLDKNLRGNEMDNVKNQSNDHIEYLDLCPGCKSDAITVLKKP